jgi:adenylate cyclase
VKSIAMRFIREWLARRQIRGMFGSYLSPEKVAELARSIEAPAPGGEEREITPFFCSINAYVGLTEMLPLASLPELMNRYFTACTDAIQAEGGTLDKYVGDAVIAMFGAPIRQPDHALRACVAALKIQDEIARLRESFRREETKWPESVRNLRVRIGFNSGNAIIGNMGTATRFNFTMMGDEVNLAARMESGAKHYGVWTLCTGATKHACEQAQPGRVIFRPLDKIIVKGRANQVELFEPFALAEDTKEEWRECLEVYGRGLACYEAGDWDGAIRLFAQSSPLERDQPDGAQGIAQNPSVALSRMAAVRKNSAL